jgi:phosphopantothenoylcysteine synthetase/decarboxylase
MKILITSGATREPIDSVRYITNMSSGRTGVALAEHLDKKGHEVWLLRGIGSAVPHGEIKSASFVDFFDLNEILKKILGEEKFGGVIHLAAVSDYSVDFVKAGDETHYGPVLGKLDSVDSLDVRLKKNFKIIEKLKSYSPRPLKVVGFKLTSGAGKNGWRGAVDKLYGSRQVDLVVHNDLEEMTGENHPFRLVFPDGESLECPSTAAMAEAVAQEFV